jgi:formylglycine-generating enzyme required for sulfatase activity
MAKGDAAFKQGRYSEAKTYYETAKKCNGGNPTEAQKKINQCNAKLNPAPKPTQSSSPIPKTNQTFTVNGVSFKMVYVQGGTFTMGCTSEQVNECNPEEKPAHTVTLSDFYMGETEVTQELWETVMGSTVRELRDIGNPNWQIRGEVADHPMYYVNWNEAVEFCKKLNEKLRDQLPSGYIIALPTEAQWEYAARGGRKSRHYMYAGSNSLDDVAWYNGNSSSTTHPVKSKLPNELGLYDMSGSVCEWCSDYWHNYSSTSKTNPKGPSSGSSRVNRGGSYSHYDWSCRVSDRNGSSPSCRSDNFGFRLAIVRQ